MAMPSQALAQSKADPLEGTLSQKVSKKDPFYGFGVRLGLNMGTGVNMEPEAAHFDMAYQFKATWKFGKLITKKGWAKLLNLSLQISLSHQPVGSSGLYRTGDVDPRIGFNLSTSLPIADAGALIQMGNDSIQRTETGATKTARVSDLYLTLAHGQLYKIPKAKIAFDGAFRLMFPTSVRSRNSTMLMAMTLALGASRSFKFKAGKVKQTMTVGYSFGISKYFHTYKTGALDTIDEGFTVEGVYVDEPFHGELTTLNPNYAVSNDFFVTYGFYKGLSLTLSYGMLSYRTYQLTNCSYSDGITTDVCDNTAAVSGDREPVGLRDYHGFSAVLSYSPLPYLGLQLVMATQTSMRTLDSRHARQPFFYTDRNGFTSIMLNAYVTLEKIYTTLTGKKKADKKAVKGDAKPTQPSASR